MATCIETMSCFPEKPLDVFNLYKYQYGIDTSIILGLFVGIIITAIYLRTRSLAHLAVMSIYSFAVFSTMWINNTYLNEQYHTMLYVITVAIATVIVLAVLKLVKE
jgi:uncharacterized membrane protein YcjF (UPF0283 family)